MDGARAVLLVLAAALALSGCGGDEPDREPRRDAATVVAGLGDSITAGTPFWDPDPAVREEFIGERADPRSQYGFWAQRRLRGTRFRNCGVNGERTDEIRTRLPECARGADALIVQGGINDIAQGRPVEDAAGDLRAIVREALDRGLRVAIVELIPWNNGPPGADREIRRLNELIAGIARAEGARLVRWYGLLSDPRDPSLMRADLTSDGNHPSVAGYRLLGQAVELP